METHIQLKWQTFVLNSLLTSMFICISVYLYNADSAVMRDLRFKFNVHFTIY